MNVLGIVTEYNPFHNGHEYQIKQLKEQTNADYCIVAMSGNFLQRGIPSILDKYNRTKMALLQGADLVIEIPSVWACSSAEYFANGGVNALLNTGVITHLGFGAETTKLTMLKTLAKIFVEHAPSIQSNLFSTVRSGKNYATARASSLNDLIAFVSADDTLTNSINSGDIHLLELAESNIDEILNSSNNILAIEYLKVLYKQNSSVIPVSLPRKGGTYNTPTITGKFSSATSIRNSIFDGENSNWIDAVPSSTKDIILNNEQVLVHEDDISSMLGYKLFLEKGKKYDTYADCSIELSNKIEKNIYDYEDFTQFRHLLKSKDVTYTRLSRILLHILLNIKKTDYELGKDLDYTPYLRILGFNKESKALLGHIKHNCSIPMITKVANAYNILDSKTYSFFENDIYTSDIYNQIILNKFRDSSLLKNEFTHQIVIV
ncbi:nucleotidyltransferase family protein [Lachnobacterium bovis]|uniref:tRNA(Met) cytidine acetate ligase n=1 Tax=Lachnobacterium bovis TaxID=140626 RepID=UPI0003B7B6C2|nr:nucleotidyltransferase family protein [Lachnobacterium bovis]